MCACHLVCVSVCLPFASMCICQQHVCLLPVCMPVPSMCACSQHVCLLPVCVPVASTLPHSLSCQNMCLSSACVPVASVYACCQYMCLSPVSVSTILRIRIIPIVPIHYLASLYKSQIKTRPELARQFAGDLITVCNKSHS